jgi:phenylalanyl-tRNA synthetase beta chain
MLVPLSWLQELVPLDLPVDDLVAVLSDLGTPVESVRHVGGGLDGVVVAKVLEVGPIEGADKIRRVLVDAGQAEPVQVVCGAWNFDVGATVPLATVGSVLPGDFAIAKRKMKGVESHGMLCAPDELGLPGDHSGILLLDDALVPGADFADAMGIRPDVVFELEVNPNRPDAMSIVGVARDLAARLSLPFHLPQPAVTGGPTPPVTVEVDDPDGCPRFTARVVSDVVVGPSPAWLADRLTLAGMRPINNVVDASNYVMLELGHPNHAYDLAKVAGAGLRVRRAWDGETLVTLDEVTRTLGPQDLLICDATDAPVGVAGIMGGSSSEVDETTTSVLLEVATFDPMTISWTSKRLGLRSEASARFEKGVDADGIDLAIARFCELLGATAGETTVDVRAERPAPVPVRVRTARVNGVLGTELTDGEIKRYLDPIGFATTIVEAGQLDVLIPGFRPDSAAEIDVIEEVLRMHGYAAVERTVPTSTLTGGLTTYQRDRRRVRDALVGVGAAEAWTTTFFAAADLDAAGLDASQAVVVANPLAVEESLLRPSLLPGLVRALAYNASHRNTGVWLFEVGNTFGLVDLDSLPDERERVAVALAGEDAAKAVEIWHVLAETLLLQVEHRFDAAVVPGLHPTRSARVLVDGADAGAVGEIDPAVLERAGIGERVAWLELDLGVLLGAPHGADHYRPISRFPSSDVDLSFEVDESVPAAAVLRTLRTSGVGEVVDVALLDVYRGAAIGPVQRSLTFRIRLQSADRTLTDEQLGAARQRLIDAVEQSHPATLRG